MFDVNKIQEHLGDNYIVSHTDKCLFIYNKKKNKNATVSHNPDDFNMPFEDFKDKILAPILTALDKYNG